jgi:hypothetical protein
MISSRRSTPPTVRPPGGTPRDTGQTMEFFNMQNNDAPLFKSLADKYTMSDIITSPCWAAPVRTANRSSLPIRVLQRRKGQSNHAFAGQHL